MSIPKTIPAPPVAFVAGDIVRVPSGKTYRLSSSTMGATTRGTQLRDGRAFGAIRSLKTASLTMVTMRDVEAHESQAASAELDGLRAELAALDPGHVLVESRRVNLQSRIRMAEDARDALDHRWHQLRTMPRGVAVHALAAATVQAPACPEHGDTCAPTCRARRGAKRHPSRGPERPVPRDRAGNVRVSDVDRVVRTKPRKRAAAGSVRAALDLAHGGMAAALALPADVLDALAPVLAPSPVMTDAERLAVVRGQRDAQTRRLGEARHISKLAERWQQAYPCPPEGDEPELHALWIAVEADVARREGREPVIEGDQTPTTAAGRLRVARRIVPAELTQHTEGGDCWASTTADALTEAEAIEALRRLHAAGVGAVRRQDDDGRWGVLVALHRPHR